MKPIFTTIYFISAEHPCQRIRETQAEIRTKKYSWAILPNGKKKLVGCTAFYTVKSAERAKLGYLTKLVNSKWSDWVRFNKPDMYALACKQIVELGGISPSATAPIKQQFGRGRRFGRRFV